MTQTVKRARPPRKSVAEKKPTSGARLIAEMSHDDDPYSLTFLIEEAAHTADYLEVLNALLKGDRQSWLDVKIGVKTVSVVVNDVLVRRGVMAEQLRKLMYEIHRQRVSLGEGPGDDGDDPTDV